MNHEARTRRHVDGRSANRLSKEFFVTLPTTAFFVLFVVSAAAAHHGLTGADATKTVTVRGTVAAMEWQNPHVTVTVSVQGAGGKTEQWVVSLMPPGVMVRKGLERGVLKVGDVISATGYASTSSRAINSIEFTLPDGRTFTTGNEKWRPGGSVFPK